MKIGKISNSSTVFMALLPKYILINSNFGFLNDSIILLYLISNSSSLIDLIGTIHIK